LLPRTYQAHWNPQQSLYPKNNYGWWVLSYTTN
jgi:hypothetical protein